MIRRLLSALLVIALTVAACSGDGNEDSAAPNGAATESASDQDTSGDDSDVLATSETTATSTGADEPVVTVDEPAVRVPTNEGQIEASNWLARTFMDSGSVELVWSPVDGAKTYRLYRIPTAEADYDAISTGDFGAAEEIYDGSEYGYIDRDVETGTFLTYLVVAELDEGNTEARWTEALTLDDVTPPTAVGNLTAELTDEGVLLTWDPSSDDVEFAAYNVTLVDDNGTGQYLGGGADIGQTSFLDNDPADGLNRYVVTAVDFHDNISAPAQVEIEG